MTVLSSNFDEICQTFKDVKDYSTYFVMNTNNKILGLARGTNISTKCQSCLKIGKKKYVTQVQFESCEYSTKVSQVVGDCFDSPGDTRLIILLALVDDEEQQRKKSDDDIEQHRF